MENIYKVKIKTNPDSRGLYPSERRYSASTVLGLSICHFFFSALMLIFGILNFASEPHAIEDIDTNLVHQNINNSNEIKSFFLEVSNSKNREIIKNLNSITKFYLILSTLSLAVGCLLAGLAGLLAWKRWYMDNNIKWFFATTLCTTFLSIVSITCVVIMIVMLGQNVSTLYNHPQVKIHLHVHILIASIIELIFSIISAVIAYAGMKRNYSDDMMPKGTGKMEINTITKGNKKCKISPPDIINHFHVTEKFAKYFPKKDNNNLPKAESNLEYEERVRKFLSSNSTDSVYKS